MTKFHINNVGEPGVCHATRQCPFGGDDKHYGNKEDARKAYEATMQNNFITYLKTAPDYIPVAEERMPDGTFITIPDANDNFGMPIAESYSNIFSSLLIPGTYKGYFYNEDTAEDEPVIVTVTEDGKSYSNKLLDPLWYPKNDTGAKDKKEKALEVANDIDSLNDKVYSMKVADETASRIREIVDNNDFDTLTGASKGIDQLKDLQSDFNKKAHDADVAGENRESATYFFASENLADQIGTFFD